jgi:formylglycine-generating enzyme required for sulfatase activity
VIHVSWTEAMGFCEWINSLKLTPDQLGLTGVSKDDRWQVRLPSEAEWEYAARGPQERWLPWLPREDQNCSPPKAKANDLAGRCNMAFSGIKSTSPVGMYPEGETFSGAGDMIGNVWEWTRSLWCDTPARQEQVEDELEKSQDQLRVLRGGSWADDIPEILRSATRFDYLAELSLNSFGFRVVCVMESGR